MTKHDNIIFTKVLLVNFKSKKPKTFSKKIMCKVIEYSKFYRSVLKLKLFIMTLN